MNLADELLSFKSDPTTNDSAAALVLGDDDAVRVLAAFRNVEHKWRAPKKKRPESPTLIALWRWLTSSWEIDVAGIGEAAGLSEEVVEGKIEMLLANRLIYPDGTIAEGAVRALNMHTQVKLGIKPKATRQQQQAPKAPDTKKESN